MFRFSFINLNIIYSIIRLGKRLFVPNRKEVTRQNRELHYISFASFVAH